jgi:hypothetical protein
MGQKYCRTIEGHFQIKKNITFEMAEHFHYVFRHMVKAHDRTNYTQSIVNCDVSALPYRTPLPDKNNFARDQMVYANDILWICGGDLQLPGYVRVANCGKVNLITKQLEDMASMSVPRHWFQMVHVEGKIYALMGVLQVTSEVFDIATETWSPLPDFPINGLWR